MNSEELSQFTDHWYVTAGDGDAVVRVFPGMSLGETETGELSLDGSDAMLSLSIGSDELLVVFVVNGGELESEDEEVSNRRHLAVDSAALIRLPNNILRFDKGILSEAGTDAPSQPRAAWRIAAAEKQTQATGSMNTANPPSAPDFNVPEVRVSEVNVPLLTEPLLNEPLLNEPLLNEPLIIAPEPSAPERDEPQSTSVTPEPPTLLQPTLLDKVPDKTLDNHKRRQRAGFTAATAGLGCVLIWLVYAGLRTDLTQEQSAPVARQVELVEASRQSEAEQIAAEAESLREQEQAAQLAEKTAAESRRKQEQAKTDRLAAEEESRRKQEQAQMAQASERAAERAEAESRRKQKQALAVQLAEKAEAESRREQEQAQIAQASERAAEEAEAESRREQEQAQTNLLMYERDLLAAELALAQGRLMQPPEDSAYTLYKQLVASYPESSAARSGFQALGAALVNRAFAELAAKRWSDARVTLAAAAEAGASPNLVANLSGEVDYQQRLADAQAGRFAALYPEAELVALNRTTPSLRRYAPDGIDMVQIEFTISVAGNVQDIEVLGAPPQRLERVVRQAVTDWRFEPVLSGSRPIPVRTRVGLEIP